MRIKRTVYFFGFPALVLGPGGRVRKRRNRRRHLNLLHNILRRKKEQGETRLRNLQWQSKTGSKGEAGEAERRPIQESG